MRFCLCFLVLSVTLGQAAVAAQDDRYPAKPIRAIVPFPAGGAMDVAARTVFDSLAQSLQQPIVVENRPGASGNIGTQQAVRAAADGYTILLGAAVNTAVSPFMYKTLDYSVQKDLAPVAQFGNAINVVYVHPSFPAATLREVIDTLRRNPDKYAYASPGSGTTVHLTMELLRAHERFAVRHVPFKGSPAAITAVAGDQLKLGIDAAGPILPFLQGARVRPVAVTGQRRFGGLPDVPTLAEAGVVVDLPASYLGVYVPAGVAPEIVAKLSGAVRKALATPEVSAKLRQLGIEPEYLDSDAFSARVDKERAMWGNAVKMSGARLD